MTTDELITFATDFYLASGNFNGYPGQQIHSQHGLSYEDIRELVERLLLDGQGTIIFGDHHANPHIRGFPDEPYEKQLEKLSAASLESACLYPTAKHLATIVTPTDFNDRPFTRELALGAGHLEHRSFDLSVLEIYRNDPRYDYTNDDIRGHIYVSDEFYESPLMHERDQIFLKTFGFAYDDDLNRAVAVFLTYLNALSPEHQQIWKSKQVSGGFRLHPDYYRNSILGEWGTRMSVFNAFLEELNIINLMCSAMDRPPLFRDTFEKNRPRSFSFMVRPTQEEFNDFVMILDKMMSDNISKDFFEHEVPDETETTRTDGKIAVQPRGTISMLNDWLSQNYKPDDPQYMNDMITTFKRVRKLRQSPAHSLKADLYDQQYIRQQRELVIEAYSAIRTLRQIFANHPAVRKADIEISEFVFEGKIWTM